MKIYPFQDDRKKYPSAPPLASYKNRVNEWVSQCKYRYVSCVYCTVDRVAVLKVHFGVFDSTQIVVSSKSTNQAKVYSVRCTDGNDESLSGSF